MISFSIKKIILFIGILFISINSYASDLTGIQIERSKYLFDVVRCPVCDGQTLSGSEATIAVDLKNHITQQILEGKTDNEIITNLRNIYGDDIIQIPPRDQRTYLLWFGPYIVMGLIFIVWFWRKKKKS